MVETSSETLMRRFVDGDEQAFAQLVERHYTGMYQYVYRFFGGRVDSEDLVQEIFLKIVKSAPRYKVKAKFTTWLYRIAHNACIDHHRKISRFTVVSMDADTGSEEETVMPLKERLSDSGPPGTRNLLSSEIQGYIRQAIATLPPEQRTVFLLREEQKLPFDEVARVMGCNVNTAKSRMRYALERLGAYLKEKNITEEVLGAYAL